MHTHTYIIIYIHTYTYTYIYIRHTHAHTYMMCIIENVFKMFYCCLKIYYCIYTYLPIYQIIKTIINLLYTGRYNLGHV